MKLSLLVVFLGVCSVCSAIQLPSYFASSMVLQYGKPITFWGLVQPGAAVTVNFGKSGHAGTAYKTTASADSGRFAAVLAAEPLSTDPYSITITATTADVNSNVSTSTSTATLVDVMVGNVFVCSGQSNMELQVANTWNATAEAAAAADYGATLRIFQVATELTYSNVTTPQTNLTASIPWARPTASSVLGMSAMCYYFGVEQVKRHPSIPVGMMASSWGGTSIRVWMSPPAVKACSAAAEQGSLPHDARAPAWQRNPDPGIPAFAAGGAVLQAAPTAVWGALTAPTQASTLYNAMIAPLLPLAVSGYLWYQGEANAASPNLYQCQFPQMITQWRSDWAKARPNANLAPPAAARDDDNATPFIFVQLAPWPAYDIGLISVQRYAQLGAFNAGRVGMVVAADIGDPSGAVHPIHPPWKQEVARRAALSAENLVHGSTTTPLLGPRPVKVTFNAWEPSWGLYHHGVAGGVCASGGPDGVWKCGGVQVEFDQPIVLKNVAGGEGNAMDRGMGRGSGFELWNNVTTERSCAAQTKPGFRCPELGPTGDVLMTSTCTDWNYCPLSQPMEVSGVLDDGKTLQLNVTFIQGYLKTLKYAWHDYPVMVVYDAVNNRPAAPFNVTIVG